MLCIGTLPYCLYTQKNMFSVYITSEQTSFLNVDTLKLVFLHLTALLLLMVLLLRSVVILMNACFLFDDNFCYHICTKHYIHMRQHSKHVSFMYTNTRSFSHNKITTTIHHNQHRKLNICLRFLWILWPFKNGYQLYTYLPTARLFKFTLCERKTRLIAASELLMCPFKFGTIYGCTCVPVCCAGWSDMLVGSSFWDCCIAQNFLVLTAAFLYIFSPILHKWVCVI